MIYVNLTCTDATIILALIILAFMFAWMIIITKVFDIIIMKKLLLACVFAIFHTALLLTKVFIVRAKMDIG